jgi:hypothetical protein
MTVETFRDAKRIANLSLKISTSEGHPSKVRNIVETWPDFVRNRLMHSRESAHTVAAYKELSDADKLREKRKGGYFVGSQFEDGIRQTVCAKDRYVLSFDMDEATPDLVGRLKRADTPLGDIEYVVYSTLSHTKEKPKIRVVIPLTKPIPQEKFTPLSRIVADLMDPGLACVDPVSFRIAQFMYYPAHKKDVKPLFIWNEGALLNADAVLEAFGNWRDYAALPKSPKEKDLRKSGDKAQNPLEKTGLVGAFCREYDIHQAIEEFLPGVYVPSQRDMFGEIERYTYAAGTGVNGAIVYDEGVHLYSQHGSDPCGGTNVNAFDMVRLHLFGMEDVGAEVTSGTGCPSYKKMAEMASKLPAIADAMLKARYPIDDNDIDDAFDVPEAEPETADDRVASIEAGVREASRYVEVREKWETALDRNLETGTIKSSLHNIVLILTYAKKFAGKFAYNEFTNTPVLLQRIESRMLNLYVPGPSRRGGDRPIQPHDLIAVRLLLESPYKKDELPGWGMKVSQIDLHNAVEAVCKMNPIHPVKDFLRSLPAWDRKPRVEQLFVRVCHTPDTPYFREVARLLMIAMVARIEQPGCKWDHAIMVEGPQGIGKSSFLKGLSGPRWHGEIEGQFENLARFVEAIQGRWILEMPELVQFGKIDQNILKAMITKTEDKVRLAYRPAAETFPRQSVLVGTTNDKEYLRDPTGNRRYFPIPCGEGRLDLAWLKANREQLFAEAVWLYKDLVRRSHNMDGLPLYLTNEDAIAEALEYQRTRVVSDDSITSMVEDIEAWLETPVPVAMAKPGANRHEPADDMEVTSDGSPVLVKRNMVRLLDVWELALERKKSEYNNSNSKILGLAMRDVRGWRRAKNKVAFGWQQYLVYVRIGSEADNRK